MSTKAEQILAGLGGAERHLGRLPVAHEERHAVPGAEEAVELAQPGGGAAGRDDEVLVSRCVNDDAALGTGG